ncbi:5'-3' exonuclease PLD3-like isoform X3 [Amblyomma americanum]
MGIRISSIYRETVLDSAGKLDFGEFELQLFDGRYMNKRQQQQTSDVKLGSWLKPSCIPISIILLLIVLVVLFPLLGHSRDGGFSGQGTSKDGKPVTCLNSCSFTLLESIPENLTFASGSPSHVSTYEGWKTLLQLATREIKIASFYWTLRGGDIYEDPSDWQGEDIFKEIVLAGQNRSIDIKIAQNKPKEKEPNLDTEELVQQGVATVRSVDFEHLLGAGVLHTKFWIVDDQHIYVGSANMDWRSLTQVKELGALILNCGCLAKDLDKVFQVYWDLGLPNATVPTHWPADLSTNINVETPASVDFNGTSTQTYFSSSPPSFCPDGRTGDIDGILDVITSAQEFIHIAVMDYLPVTQYTKEVKFWPRIDDALRAAAIERGIEVHLLISKWNHTHHDMYRYLRSLSVLRSRYINLHVKLFEVPAFTPEQELIPFGRVNHNKYMVTDNKAYIGTSNWTPDYFINTAGVGLIMDQSGNYTSSQPIREQLNSVFERDWNSPYAQWL